MKMKRLRYTMNTWRSLLGRLARRRVSRAIHFCHVAGGVEAVLHYLRDAAGFVIDIRPNVPIEQSKTAPTGHPMTEEHALVLLQQAVTDIGCVVLQKGRQLTILTVQEAKKQYMSLPTIGQE